MAKWPFISAVNDPVAPRREIFARTCWIHHFVQKFGRLGADKSRLLGSCYKFVVWTFDFGAFNQILELKMLIGHFVVELLDKLIQVTSTGHFGHKARSSNLNGPMIRPPTVGRRLKEANQMKNSPSATELITCLLTPPTTKSSTHSLGANIFQKH